MIFRASAENFLAAEVILFRIDGTEIINQKRDIFFPFP